MLIELIFFTALINNGGFGEGVSGIWKGTSQDTFFSSHNKLHNVNIILLDAFPGVTNAFPGVTNAFPDASVG